MLKIVRETFHLYFKSLYTFLNSSLIKDYKILYGIDIKILEKLKNYPKTTLDVSNIFENSRF